MKTYYSGTSWSVLEGGAEWLVTALRWWNNHFLGSLVLCVSMTQCPSPSWLVQAKQWLHLSSVFPPSPSAPQRLAGFQAENEPCYHLSFSSITPGWQHVCSPKSSWGFRTFNSSSWWQILLSFLFRLNIPGQQTQTWTSGDRETNNIWGSVVLLKGATGFISEREIDAVLLVECDTGEHWYLCVTGLLETTSDSKTKTPNRQTRVWMQIQFLPNGLLWMSFRFYCKKKWLVYSMCWWKIN